MNALADFLGLYRALLWRLWIEQRRTLIATPLVMVLLFTLVLLTTRFAPGLLTGPSLHALRTTAELSGAGDTTVALPRAFLEHQAPFLLAFFASLSAATIAAGVIGGESERGSLELLLATRHRPTSIGLAVLLAASSLASLAWVALAGLSVVVGLSGDAWLRLGVDMTASELGAAVAMQLVLTALAAELAMMALLTFPRLARMRGSLLGDPTRLLATIPAVIAFVLANLIPQISMLRLSLGALACGTLLLALGATTLRWWFRPEQFLET
jgi:hypothetical protein